MSSEIKPIGVFDSGLGGLEILRHIVKTLPQHDYLYLGDNARAPYGSRSQELIYQFTRQAVDFLFERGCILIILACNTASSEALRRLQQEYLPQNYPEHRILGVIIPTVEAAVIASTTKKFGVIATQGTVNSMAFPREIMKLSPYAQIWQQACPLLVPIIEAGEQGSLACKLMLKKYLTTFNSKQIDALILGCTHYGLLAKNIRKIIGPNIKIIAEGQIIGQKLVTYLKNHPEIESRLTQNSQIRFLTTDLTDNFQKLGSHWFGQSIKPESIALE